MAEEEDYASKFMLQEYTRIIDAYHELHRQKDELIKFYLTFLSLPVSVVAIFLALSRFLQGTPQPGAGQAQVVDVVHALEHAGTFLSFLLVLVGGAVMMSMLRIRGEQYLYIKTINGARRYFKDKFAIEAEKYLVLPSELNQLTFGQEELSGRAFWDSMIVASTTSVLVGFLSYELFQYMKAHLPYFGAVPHYVVLAVPAIVFFTSLFIFRWFVRNALADRLVFHGLIDITAAATAPTGPASGKQKTAAK
jgi:hypothetical protein